MTELQLLVVGADGSQERVGVSVRQVLLAGYTGRDRTGVLEHIRELEDLGVRPPERIPMIYDVPPSLVGADERLLASSDQTSGEVEFYLVHGPDGLLVGVGSDHTDRKVEADDVAASKSLCAKVISPDVWRLQDVQDHWDQLEIRAWASKDGQRQLYQDGRLDALLPVEDILAELNQAGYADLRHTLVFGGTIPTLGGFIFSTRFEAELRDPVLQRSLHCAYDVVPAARSS
jgi:hypothetical protein